MSISEKPIVSLIIPAYNEEKTIEKIILNSFKVLKKNYNSFEIVVMDDCSTDRTAKICQDLAKKIKNLRVLLNKKNIGKTKNLIKGFEIVQSDVAAFIDADYQYSPEDLPKIIDKIIKYGYDISSGRRENRHDSLHRKLASKAFNLFNRVMFDIKIDDVNCGLKAIRRDVFDKIQIKYLNAKWFVDTELLAKARRNRLKVCQTSIKHMKRKEGRSKVNILNLASETVFYGLLLKFRFLFKKS